MLASARMPTPQPICPVCDSVTSRTFVAVRDMITYKCRSCDTVYLFPPPTQETVDALYTDAYAGASTGYFTKVEKKLRRSRGRMRRLRAFVGSGRFLDIGCNGGFMVHAAQQLGFDPFGIDLDPISIAYAKTHYPDCHFSITPVEQFATTAEPFDLVYCSEVIEHVPAPRAFAAAIARLAKPGGYLYITTPDISHWRVPTDVTQWDAFGPPSHCVYFNPASLANLLKGAGFTVVKKMIAFKPGIKLLCRKIAP
jgi:SAM-dependent methyltransferase